MKKSAAFIVLLLGLAVLLSGCATGLTPSSWPGMTADAENAYLAGGPFVYAVNLQTGAQTWRFPDKASAANPFFAAPTLTADGQLIVGGFDKKLYSLNPQTGKSNWQFVDARDRWIGGALVAGGMIYAPNADYKLYALDLQGSLQWSFEADQSIWGTPVSDGTNVYFGTLGRKVYAVNAQTGEKAWMVELDGAVLGSPVLGTGNTLYLATHGGTVYALKTANGQTLWSEAASSWMWSAPALNDSFLYYGDSDGSLYAHPLSGTGTAWKQELNGAVIGSPLVVGDQIAVGTESGNLYLVSLDGQTVQPIAIPGTVGQFYATPITAGNLFLAAPTGGDNTLIAFDQTGAIKWSFIPPK